MLDIERAQALLDEIQGLQILLDKPYYDKYTDELVFRLVQKIRELNNLVNESLNNYKW